MSAASIAVIGGGPAGLMAAETLAKACCAVTVYERMPTLGRRFLMAGIGGLNLTHSEAPERFIERYGEVAGWITPLLGRFGPADIIAWADGLGAQSFTGSSGRVFPKVMKASPMLRAWIARLEGLGVEFALRHDWQGWDGDALLFEAEAGRVERTFDATILALGGASWPRLGANGAWVRFLADRGIETAPLIADNCGAHIPWSAHMERHFGTPLKNIALSCGTSRALGEPIVTRSGLEGGAVYGLNPAIREELAKGEAALTLDLKPSLDTKVLAARLSGARKGDSMSNRLRKAGLGAAEIAVLREGGALPSDASALAGRIKATPLKVSSLAGIERAISTTGGIRLSDVDEGLMLRGAPGVFACGEMLDWSAPTGGYLLTGCLSTGRAAAEGALAFLHSH